MRPMPSRVVSIGSGSANDRDAAFGQFVHQVEHLAQVATQPVQRVHDNDVPVAGVAQQLRQTRAVDGGAGLLVAVRSDLPGCPTRPMRRIVGPGFASWSKPARRSAQVAPARPTCWFARSSSEKVEHQTGRRRPMSPLVGNSVEGVIPACC
jgi:hypothetical protein